MAARLIRIAIIVALVAVAVFFLTQEQYQRPIRRAWSDVQQSDGWKSLRKTWQRAYKKTQVLVTKAQEGKLSEDIAMYVDKTTQSYLGVGLAGLEEYLDGLNESTAGTILFVSWLLIGYLLYRCSSSGTAVFMMALMVLVHSMYGQTWCLYQLIVLAGLMMYLFSLVANNIVIAAMLVFIIYALTTFAYFLGNESPSLRRLEEKVDHVHYQTARVDHRVSDLSKKVDKLGKKPKPRHSSGED